MNLWGISVDLFENNISESLMPPLPERADHQYSVTERSESCFSSMLGVEAVCLLTACLAPFLLS